MKKLLVSVLVLTGITLIACNSEEKKTDAPAVAEEQNDKKFDSTNMNKDADFAVFAADGGMAEVDLGKIALTNASSQSVKDLGKMLVDDHSKANEELKALAQQNNITLPATVSDDHKKKAEELSEKKGAEFDKAYLDAMQDGHEKTISKFETESSNGNNMALKQWATDKLPALKHHLEMIKQIKDGMKK